MILFEEAFELVMSKAKKMGQTQVTITESLNRILAEDIVSDMDMPPFNKSAMDGYAIRRSDLSKELTILETIAAGYAPTKKVGAKECSKIMTGSRVPQGADCVVKVEDTALTAPGKISINNKKTADNICLQGEDVKRGETLLKKGTIIKPQDIAVLASTGYNQILVNEKPKIGIIATGDELVEPGEPRNHVQIRNSNSYQLAAQLQKIGIFSTYYGIAKDTEIALKTLIKKAKQENDLILLSGGVSMGDFDLVPKILQDTGFKLLFQKIKIKPGKPTVFGISDDCYCFGLPGNPVSTFVLFEYLVKEFIYKLMGSTENPLLYSVTLKETITRKNGERKFILPVKIDKGMATPLNYHGSGHLNVLSQTDGFIEMPTDILKIKKDSKVNVRPI